MAEVTGDKGQRLGVIDLLRANAMRLRREADENEALAVWLGESGLEMGSGAEKFLWEVFARRQWRD